MVAEINLQGAKLYLFAICLLSADRQSHKSLRSSDTWVLLHNVLQWGHSAALCIINLMAEMGASRIDDPPCAAYESGGCPLLAHPKHHFRIAFFACLFLLKYLDCNEEASEADKEAARNAVSRIYQLFIRFRSSDQHIRAAKTIEVLGRTIVPGHGKIITQVKTRLGASLFYNAMWTAAKLRGRHNDPEYSTTAAPSMQSNGAPCATGSASPLMSVAVPQSSDMISQHPSAFDHSFPWGLWDDNLFDALGFEWDKSPCPDMLGAMDTF